MTTTDSLTRLATIRPDEDPLAHDWSPARRADVLARVHAATSDAPAAAHLDLAWLHTRLLRLRGSRLWLGGWRFDVDDPLGPAAQGHLLQAWLRFAERDPA